MDTSDKSLETHETQAPLCAQPNPDENGATASSPCEGAHLSFTPSGVEGEKRALAAEAFQPVIESLERMEQEDPKLAIQAARLVGLYRRLWESCIAKHHDGQQLATDNNQLRITNIQLLRERESLKQRQNNQIARLSLFEHALEQVREGIVGVLKDWDRCAEAATSVSWEGVPLGSQ
ncbi:uncharacterized protein N7446_007914 [Penicillium canescens]|uniref:uncharacterized protein n=1 Tax=Penicillium canescens TaxID=5083 RepID=UPI0026DFF0ED|nr:uncharacterized protein N7446_007869 [Penicillium canescens]XP_058370305.1 uncharacterized protein N7446_007914 [Penicillium canescens]KAJ6058286.1 hypothetical protein N7446_007869 [Penicillium canescens]KAJ6058331.1 hypothetical protein N7446_007914 [Penicillium canescens]